MPGRNANPGDYKYGFNGIEKDDELKGSGNSYDFGARIYDPRIGRFLSIDPLANNFSDISPYIFAINSPISFIDVKGKNAGVRVNHDNKTIIITANYYVVKGDVESLNKAKEAAEYWNSKTSDTRGGFKYEYEEGQPSYKIAFDIKVIESENVSESIANDEIGNSFEIDNQKVDLEEKRKGSSNVGAYSEGRGVVTRPNSSVEENAHEMGHDMGLGHFSHGLMVEEFNLSNSLERRPTVGNINMILNQVNLANPLVTNQEFESGRRFTSAIVKDLGSKGVSSGRFFGSGNVVPASIETYTETMNPDYEE